MKPINPFRTPGYLALSQSARTGADGDAWGWVQGWWFAVAHTLHHVAPEELPAEWEYRDSPLCPQSPAGAWRTAPRELSYEEEVITSELLWGLTISDLVLFGRVLSRYAEWCRMAGRDY